MSLLSTKSGNLFSGFTKEQIYIFKKLDSPKKIQDFLESLKANFKETNFSPKKVLEEKRAHCFEGALLAAAILRFHGHKPLILDLKTIEKDDDHVITVFKKDNHWGAISKTNHAILRYRDPVFRNIRELVLSFFSEYFLENGIKTLRSYSKPVDLSKFDRFGWMTTGKNLDFIADYLDKVPHKKILTSKMVSDLRKKDPIERKILKFVQWEKNN